MFGKKRKLKQPRPASDFKNAGIMQAMSILIVLISLGGLAVVMFFLRTSILTTIDEVESLVLIQPGEAIEIIDFRRLDSVLETWQKKESLTVPSIERNPFVAIVTTPIPSQPELPSDIGSSVR